MRCRHNSSNSHAIVAGPSGATGTATLHARAGSAGTAPRISPPPPQSDGHLTSDERKRTCCHMNTSIGHRIAYTQQASGQREVSAWPPMCVCPECLCAACMTSATRARNGEVGRPIQLYTATANTPTARQHPKCKKSLQSPDQELILYRYTVLMPRPIRVPDRSLRVVKES